MAVPQLDTHARSPTVRSFAQAIATEAAERVQLKVSNAQRTKNYLCSKRKHPYISLTMSRTSSSSFSYKKQLELEVNRWRLEEEFQKLQQEGDIWREAMRQKKKDGSQDTTQHIVNSLRIDCVRSLGFSSFDFSYSTPIASPARARRSGISTGTCACALRRFRMCSRALERLHANGNDFGLSLRLFHVFRSGVLSLHAAVSRGKYSSLVPASPS